MIHAKMTKPRNKIATTAKTVAPTTKTSPKKPVLGLTSGRSFAGPPIGSTVEVLIDGLWWPGKVDAVLRALGLFHVNLFAGAPTTGAAISLHGEAWRLANRLHSAPLTRQGVRNLDTMAPPRFRNGRKFRKPQNFEAICPHPEEAMSEDLIEEEVEALDENRERYTYTLRFLSCFDCGAEVSI